MTLSIICLSYSLWQYKSHKPLIRMGKKSNNINSTDCFDKFFLFIKTNLLSNNQLFIVTSTSYNGTFFSSINNYMQEKEEWENRLDYLIIYH